MRRSNLVVPVVVLISSSPGPSSAVSESVGPWLLFSMGARASGMGGAQVTEAVGADRLYWNPALLGFQSGWSVTSMYFQPVPDLTDDVELWYASTVGGWEEVGGFGLNYMYVSYGLSQGGVTTFAPWESSVGAGYGRAFSETFSAGLGLKIIHSDLFPAIGPPVGGQGHDLGGGPGYPHQGHLRAIRCAEIPATRVSLGAVHPEPGASSAVRRQWE